MSDSGLEHPQQVAWLGLLCMSNSDLEHPQQVAWLGLLCMSNSDLEHPSRQAAWFWLLCMSDSDLEHPQQVAWFRLLSWSDSDQEHPNRWLDFGLLSWSDSDQQHPNRWLDFGLLSWSDSDQQHPNRWLDFGLQSWSDSDLEHPNRWLDLDYCVVTWNTPARDEVHAAWFWLLCMSDSDLKHHSRRLDFDYYVWQWPGTPQQAAWFGLLCSDLKHPSRWLDSDYCECLTVSWKTPAGGLILMTVYVSQWPETPQQAAWFWWLCMSHNDLKHPSRRLDFDDCVCLTMTWNTPAGGLILMTVYVSQWPETPQQAAWFWWLCMSHNDLKHPSRRLDFDDCVCLTMTWNTPAGGLILMTVYVSQWPETPQQAAWFWWLCMSHNDLKHPSRRLDFDYYVWQWPGTPQQAALFGLLCMSDSDLKHHSTDARQNTSSKFLLPASAVDDWKCQCQKSMFIRNLLYPLLFQF